MIFVLDATVSVRRTRNFVPAAGTTGALGCRIRRNGAKISASASLKGEFIYFLRIVRDLLVLIIALYSFPSFRCGPLTDAR